MIKFFRKKTFKRTIACLLCILTLTCSNDNTNDPIEQTTKKLINLELIGTNVSIPNANYTFDISYDSDDRISQIVSTQNSTGENRISNYNYENNSVISANIFSNGSLSETQEFNYMDGNLNEIVTYDNNGNEKSRKELFYNSNNQIISIDIYFEGQLLSTQGNFIYGNDGNITAIEGSNVNLVYDNNPSPYQNLSITDKIIYDFYSGEPIDLFSKNNLLLSERISNEGLPNEFSSTTVITIQYDSDNYPISRTAAYTINGFDNGTVTSNFTYE